MPIEIEMNPQTPSKEDQKRESSIKRQPLPRKVRELFIGTLASLPYFTEILWTPLFLQGRHASVESEDESQLELDLSSEEGYNIGEN